MNWVESGNKTGDIVSHGYLTYFAKKFELQLDPIKDKKPLQNCNCEWYVFMKG